MDKVKGRACFTIGLGVASIFLMPPSVWAQNALVTHQGSLAVASFPHNKIESAESGINYGTAKAFPLPRAIHPSTTQNSQSTGGALPNQPSWSSGKVEGRRGDQIIKPRQLLPKIDISNLNSAVTYDRPNDPEPQEFGTSGQVFTTSRIDPGKVTQVARFYPFSATGKLFFSKDSGSFICSGALIRPGIVVTAAHCVANWGKGEFYRNFVFVPGYYNGNAPFQSWTASQVVISNSYYYGDPAYCTQNNPGVVCYNDIALIKLNPQYPYGVAAWAGDFSGWLGYSWNGYGYNSVYQTLISQLGYPGNLDNGVLMQRTDSLGYVDFNMKVNTIIGSLQTGGSSGGPWVLNLGIPPIVTDISFGSGSGHNYVAAVTSWGYNNTEIKQQGASSFTAGNFLSLMNYICPTATDECHP